MPSQPTSTKKIIQNNRISKMIARAKNQQQVLDWVKKLMPEATSSQLSGAVIKNNILILLVNNQAWATRLRYQVNDIRISLNAEHQTQFYAVKVKVVPPSQNKKRMPTITRRRKVNAQQLFQSAMAMDDPRLSDVLARIASKAEKPENS
jgi:hypothetical protein